MAVERKFINETITKIKVGRYLYHELKGVGCSEIEVKRTPLGTRIVVHAVKPGLVIGRKGKNIEMLTNALKEKFKVENPQIEVQEVSKPEFDPRIMAEQLAATIERGIHFRRASYSMLQQIMRAGALGVQILVSGKISGARARYEKFKQGYIKHCGETANIYVRKAIAHASPKPGIVGIEIMITPPRNALFRELRYIEPVVELKEPVKVEKPAEAAEVKTEVPATEKPAIPANETAAIPVVEEKPKLEAVPEAEKVSVKGVETASPQPKKEPKARKPKAKKQEVKEEVKPTKKEVEK